jgi:hypothetical protein
MELRSKGTTPAAIATELHVDRSMVANVIFRQREVLRGARQAGSRPAVKPSGDSKDDEGEPAGALPEVVVFDSAAQEEVQPALARIRRKMKTSPDGRVRSKTIAPWRLSRDERRLSEMVVYPEDVDRPITRGDCSEMARPCPFVSCSHHLYLDVNEETGAIKLNFPHLEVWEMAESCSLDVADRGGITLEEVGAILNLTRERIRQVEVRGLGKIRDADDGSLTGL